MKKYVRGTSSSGRKMLKIQRRQEEKCKRYNIVRKKTVKDTRSSGIKM
jgi:hypothetical protein